MNAALFFAMAAVAPLADPVLERRAAALEGEIRCVSCENEPISQSAAPIAQDMRRLVRERLAAGESETEIRAFFRERYGDFVLLRPPLDGATLALWLTPPILAAIALAGFALTRRPPKERPAPEEGER